MKDKKDIESLEGSKSSELAEDKKAKKKSIAAGACAFFVILAIIISIVLYNKERNKKVFSEKMFYGDSYMKELLFDKALSEYESAISKGSKNVEAYLAAAAAYEGMKDYENAEKYYKDAIKNTKTIKAYEELMEFYIMLDKREEAKELIEKAYNNKKPEGIEQLYNKITPKAPVPDIAEGEYLELVKLSFIADEKDTIYVSVDGHASYVYDNPIILKRGTNTITAKTVNERGFESETASYTYNINIEAKQLVFEDSAVEGAVRKILGLSENEPIYSDKAAQITSLTFSGSSLSENKDKSVFQAKENCYEADVKTLNDLKYMPFLEELNIIAARNCDITGLVTAKSLKRLSLRYMDIEDVSILSGLYELEELCIANNNISNIYPVGNITNLKSLGMWNNNITDISSLSRLTKIEYFDISNNKVSDIGILSNMLELKEAWLYNNNISDISPLKDLEKLRTLMLRGNPLNDLTVLNNIANRIKRCDIEINRGSNY